MSVSDLESLFGNSHGREMKGSLAKNFGAGSPRDLSVAFSQFSDEVVNFASTERAFGKWVSSYVFYNLSHTLILLCLRVWRPTFIACVSFLGGDFAIVMKVANNFSFWPPPRAGARSP